MTDTEKKHDTASKRDLVFTWLNQNHEPGITTVTAVSKGAGVGFDTAKKWFVEWLFENGETDDAVEADDDGAAEVEPVDEPVDDADDSDNVVVSRAYLLTLEALRDQVIETARLRRMLEAR